uniref:Cocaine- and amphetamine-regulated transcript protein n=1 Tax=Denticeps clupeoides TaxID=299321 RepID=A0AAY4D990_9TELE
MESSRLRARAVACVVLLAVAARAETGDSDPDSGLDTRAIRDFYPKDPNLTDEKQLVGGPRQVGLSEEVRARTHGCDVGEQCAIRKGARIGKMCDCPRGAICNFFLLKCL